MITTKHIATFIVALCGFIKIYELGRHLGVRCKRLWEALDPESRSQSKCLSNPLTELQKMEDWQKAVFSITVNQTTGVATVFILDGDNTDKEKHAVLITAHHVFIESPTKFTLSKGAKNLVINTPSKTFHSEMPAAKEKTATSFLQNLCKDLSSKQKRQLDITILWFPAELKEFGELGVPKMKKEHFRFKELTNGNRIMMLHELSDSGKLVPKFSTCNQEVIKVTEAGFIYHTGGTEDGSSGAPIFDNTWSLCGFHIRSGVNSRLLD